MKRAIQFNRFIIFITLTLTSNVWSQAVLTVSPNVNPYQFNDDGLSNNVTLNVSNTGNQPASDGMELRLTIPDSDLAFDIVGGTPPNYIFGNWTCTLNTPQSLDCFLTTLPAGNNENIEIPVITSPGVKSFVPAINMVLEDFGGTPNSFSSVDTNYGIQPPDLFTSIAFTPGFSSPFDPVDPISVDVTVINNGGDATNVSVLFDGEEFNFNQNASDPECTFGQNGIECNVSSLLSGQSQVFTIVGVVNQTASAGTYNLNASASSFESDAFPSDNMTSMTYDIAGPAVAEINVDKFVWDGVAATGPVTDLPQNGVAEYLIYLNNEGSADATNVNLTDTLPAGVTFDPLLNGGNNPQYFQEMTGNCGFTGNTLTCNVPTVTAGATQNLVKIFAHVTGNPNDVVVNNASSTFPDSNSGNNIASATFTITGSVIPVDLEIDAFTNLNSYSTGQIFPIEVVVDNLASVDDADFVTMTLDLPIEVQYQSVAVSNIWACSHSSNGSSPGGTVICESGSNLIVGNSSHPIDINVLAVQTGNSAAYNALVSSSTTPDPDMSNNSINNSFDVFGGFNDLAITKTASLTNVNVGDTFDYQINISHNTTPASDVNDILIQDTLPSEVSYQGFTQNSTGVNFNCTHDNSPTGGMVTCDSGNSPFTFGDALDLSIHVQAESNGSVLNTASFSSLGDSTPGNNSSTAPAVTISTPFTSINVSKVALLSGVPVTEVPLGSDFSYELHVTNTGPFKVMGMDLVDLLPNDVTLLSYDGGVDWTCTDAIVGGQTEIGCSFNGDLPISASSMVTVNVTATNDINVTSIMNQMDVTATNLTAVESAQNTVNLVNASMTVNISQTPDPVVAGGQFDYVVTVNNDGTQDLSNVVLDSVLPQGIGFSSVNTDVGNCTENNGTVNCVLGNMATTDIANITLSAMAPNNPDPNINYDNQITVQSPDLGQNVLAQWSTQIVASPNADYTLTLNNSHSSSYPSASTVSTFIIRNTGNVDLDPVNLQFSVDPAFSILSYAGADFSCQTAGQQLNCSNNTLLSPGDFFRGEVTVRSGNTPGSYQHTVNANANGINKSVQAGHSILNAPVNAPDLTVVQTASASEIAVESPFEFIFNVNNIGTLNATNVSLTNTLPPGVVYDGFNGQDWLCQGTQTINCQYSGDIAPNASAPELRFAVTSPQTAGAITNHVLVNALNESNSSNNADSVTVNVLGGDTVNSDLMVELTVSENEVTAGDELNWTFEVKNSGPSVAQNVLLNHAIPMGFVSGSITQSNGLSCSLLTNSLMCELASLASGSSVQVTLSGQVNISFEGEMMGLAEVSSSSFDNNNSNNLSYAQVNVLAYEAPEADVSIQVSSSQNQILQGDTFPLSIVVKNAGPDTAEQTMVSAQISGLIEKVDVINVAPWQCQNSQASIHCQLPIGMPIASQYELNFEVSSEKIVQTAQAIEVTAMVNSDAIDPNESNNMASLTTNVIPTPTEEELLSHIEGVMGSMDSQTQQAIKNVSSYCARSFYWAMEEGMCALMWEASQEDHDEMHDMMREITPNEVLGQSNSASEIITSQFTNIDARLSELRGGGGGFSMAGLRATYGNESIPVGMLAYLSAGDDDDTNNNAVNDFVSPWGFFINGTISMGERDKTGRELGFDFDTFGITAGLDYRLSNNKVLGVALGYANFDSEIEDEAEMQSDGITLTGYGSFYVNDNFYVDTRISYGQPNFDQSRRINFSLNEVTIDRVAKGETSANQYSASLSMGYHFYKNAWNITPNASINYVNTSIDAFKESGAGGFNFEYAQQDIKSLKASMGLSVSRAFSLEKGVITPQFDINMTREMENDGGLIEARFINAPDDEIFWIETDEPDRIFGNAGLGLVFIGANGKQAYINYRSIFGLEGFTRGTINLGLRFEF
ncbi:autotransporter domain-containing protein [Marinicella rhabdoformis]|uniref:autotransporter domain-containing protein n=1 Tax=Marinicella rhabdoformis TaxID=2580566 RepID=UPI0012AEC063|nr:autotransporter domain-containing protein [Marinicella rhabdoformis]